LNTIGIKIKEVYLPFLVVSIATILFYNLFRWTFDIQLGILPLKNDLINIWFPFVLPWISVLMWLRRRIRILQVKGNSDNGYFFYQLIMSLAITAPIVVSQNYIEKASYDLVRLNHSHEVTNYSDQKYFDIHSFDVAHYASLPYVTARTSGKNNDKLTFYLYLASPLRNCANVWFGVEYKERLSNRLSDDKKDSEYRSFIEKSKKEFESYDFQDVSYFEKLGYSDERDGYLEAIKKQYPDEQASEQIILIPKFDAFEDRLGNSFPWIFRSFGIGAFVIFLMVAIPNINKKELKNFKNNKPIKDDELKNSLNFIDPRGTNKATAILLLLNMAIFIIMVFSGLNVMSPTPKELLEIGGNRRTEVLGGEYWRLLTSIFIHGGLVHLIMNLFSLGLAGSLLEGILGRVQFIMSYLVCGIIASLASIYWHTNTISVGASGAVFGLFGLILAFTIFKIYPKHMHGMTWTILGLFAGVSLLIGFFGGIDNAAHIGGLVSGFVYGGVLIRIDKRKLIKNAR